MVPGILHSSEPFCTKTKKKDFYMYEQPIPEEIEHAIFVSKHPEDYTKSLKGINF